MPVNGLQAALAQFHDWQGGGTHAPGKGKGGKRVERWA